MVIAITLWVFGGVLIYLTNRIGKMDHSINSFSEKNEHLTHQLSRCIEDVDARNHALRALINDLAQHKEIPKVKLETLSQNNAEFSGRKRRPRTDEEKKAASERAKQRWAQRKTAAKSMVTMQPEAENSATVEPVR